MMKADQMIFDTTSFDTTSFDTLSFDTVPIEHGSIVVRVHDQYVGRRRG